MKGTVTSGELGTSVEYGAASSYLLPMRTNRLSGISRSLTVLTAISASALSASALVVRAQQPVPSEPQFEGRLASIVSPNAGVLLGLGLNVRAGWYSRVGLALSAGAERARGDWRDVQRIEASVRFLFDPFAERPIGLYGGAGLGALRSASGDVQGQLLAVVGLEGSATGRTVPAVELTLGGGARLAVVIRRTRRAGR